MVSSPLQAVVKGPFPCLCQISVSLLLSGVCRCFPSFGGRRVTFFLFQDGGFGITASVAASLPPWSGPSFSLIQGEGRLFSCEWRFSSVVSFGSPYDVNDLGRNLLPLDPGSIPPLGEKSFSLDEGSPSPRWIFRRGVFFRGPCKPFFFFWQRVGGCCFLFRIRFFHRKTTPLPEANVGFPHPALAFFYRRSPSSFPPSLSTKSVGSPEFPPRSWTLGPPFREILFLVINGKVWVILSGGRPLSFLFFFPRRFSLKDFSTRIPHPVHREVASFLLPPVVRFPPLRIPFLPCAQSSPLTGGKGVSSAIIENFSFSPW